MITRLVEDRHEKDLAEQYDKPFKTYLGNIL